MAEDTCRFTKAVITNDEQRQFLRSLPLTAERLVDGVRIVLCHATPEDPLYEYRPAESDLWDVDAARLSAMFCWRTHSCSLLPNGRRRRVANPGSVGQSKRGGGRACYAIWQDGQLRLESVEYPVEETVAKLRVLPVCARGAGAVGDRAAHRIACRSPLKRNRLYSKSSSCIAGDGASPSTARPLKVADLIAPTAGRSFFSFWGLRHALLPGVPVRRSHSCLRSSSSRTRDPGFPRESDRRGGGRARRRKCWHGCRAFGARPPGKRKR